MCKSFFRWLCATLFNSSKWIVPAACFLFLMQVCFSQYNASKKDLEKRRAKLQKEIDQTSKQLQDISKNKNVSLSQVEALRKKIRLRTDLIGNINSEIKTLGSQIASASKEIKTLESTMEQLKANYTEMVLFAQANRNKYQTLMFIFSAGDFNQAYKRLKYLQQFSEYRRQEAEKISQTQNILTVKKSDLEIQKKEKSGLRNSEEKHRKDLEKEKKEQDKMVATLSENEKKLQKQLKEKLKAKEKLDRAIENIVRKEIESAKKKAVASGKKNVTNENVFALTPEAQQLSANFAGNKGSLPWPVEQGRISSTFGEHPHPQLKDVTIKNDGVDIQSNKGSQVRSVFNGEVSGTVNLPGGSAVIIRHGEYLSVYSNVEDVYVKKGDKVTTKQKIGTIRTNSESNKAELNLQIWKGFTKLNPQPWLARK